MNTILAVQNGFALCGEKKNPPGNDIRCQIREGRIGIIFTRPQYRNPLKLYPAAIPRSSASFRAGPRARIAEGGPVGDPDGPVPLSFQVSWVRHRDIHLLTVGVETYTSDQRFVASHFPHTEDWTLQVKYPQRRDSGTYECQVSTTPPIGHSMLLSVVGEFLPFFLSFSPPSFFSAPPDSRPSATRTEIRARICLPPASLMCTARASRYTRGICRAMNPLIYCGRFNSRRGNSPQWDDTRHT